MTNKIIIDGWNVCWKIPQIAQLIPDQLETARNNLNNLVKNYYQLKKVQYKIIYDGQPGMVQNEFIHKHGEIRFSKNPQKADHLIINFLKKQKNASSWTVVTSDSELSFKARNLNASVLSSETFINKIVQKGKIDREVSVKQNPNLSQNEIDLWLNLFNKDNENKKD